MNSISLLLDNICAHQSVNILQMFAKLNHSMKLQIYYNSNHSYNSWYRGHQRKKFHTIRHQLSYPSFFKDKFEPYFDVNNFYTGRSEQPLLFYLTMSSFRCARNLSSISRIPAWNNFWFLCFISICNLGCMNSSKYKNILV